MRKKRFKYASKLPERVSPVQNWSAISVKDGQSDNKMTPLLLLLLQKKKDIKKKKELVIYKSYLLEAYEVYWYVPFRRGEIKEEGIYICADDRRCVKTSFARLLPDFPTLPAAPTTSYRPSLDSNFRHFFSARAWKLPSLLSSRSSEWGETKTSL